MAKKTKETAATPAPEKPQVDEKVEKLKVKKPKTKKFEKPSDGVTKVNLKELAKKAEDVVKVDRTKIGNGKVGKYAHVFKDAYMEAIQLK